MITFYFQLLIPLAVLFYGVPRKDHFLLRFGILSIVTLGLSALYASPELVPFFSPFWQYLTYYLVGYLFGFLLVWFSFDLPILQTIFLTIEAYLMQNFAHHMFELTMRIMNVPVGAEYDSLGYLALLGSLYLIVYSVFLIVILKLRIREIARVPMQTILLGFAFLLIMIGFGVYVRHGRVDLLESRDVAIGYEIYSVSLTILFLLMHLGLFNIGKLTESNEELEMRIERESWYYEVATSNVEMLRRLNHDMKHRISALRNMENQAERETAISEMETLVTKYGGVYATGNNALDSLLTEKAMFCLAKNVTLNVVADGSLLNGLKFTDIYVLFGNAIDNAIESAMKGENQEERTIRLKIQNKNGLAFVHLENWCKEELTFVDGLPQTTKKEKGHGYGMKNIRYLVERYDGTIAIRLNDCLFTMDILLPIS